MKAYQPTFLILLLILACVWGVFLIEEGLFNSGSIDLKEFGIGVGFVLFAFLAAVILFCVEDCFVFLSQAMKISTLMLLLTVYSASVSLRWQNHEKRALLVSRIDLTVAHIGSSNEWIMIEKSMLQRPARWYETGVKAHYLADEEAEPTAIQLPAKYLPLKYIKEL